MPHICVKIIPDDLQFVILWLFSNIGRHVWVRIGDWCNVKPCVCWRISCDFASKWNFLVANTEIDKCASFCDSSSPKCLLIHWCNFVCFWAGLAGGGRNWFLLLLLSSLNWLAETPSDKNWQKLAKTQMTKTVGFLVSNCFKCTNVCLDGIGTYCALCLIGFLVGDCLKCTYMVVITIWICFSAGEVGCILLYS